jgi:hypothetical protein
LGVARLATHARKAASNLAAPTISKVRRSLRILNARKSMCFAHTGCVCARKAVLDVTVVTRRWQVADGISSPFGESATG